MTVKTLQSTLILEQGPLLVFIISRVDLKIKVISKKYYYSRGIITKKAKLGFLKKLLGVNEGIDLKRTGYL